MKSEICFGCLKKRRCKQNGTYRYNGKDWPIWVCQWCKAAITKSKQRGCLNRRPAVSVGVAETWAGGVHLPKFGAEPEGTGIRPGKCWRGFSFRLLGRPSGSSFLRFPRKSSVLACSVLLLLSLRRCGLAYNGRERWSKTTRRNRTHKRPARAKETFLDGILVVLK